MSSYRARIAAFLGLERNIVAVSAAMLLMAFGENLWKKFLPKYLEALGAPIRAIGVYGSLSDLVDGLYQYPGGWLGDHLGRRRALRLFAAAAMIGYGIYAIAPTWPLAILALFFATAWSSMGSPTLFAVVGDALPKERRAIGFTMQSILRRLPILIAPIAGGLVIARAGIVEGMHALFLVSVAVGFLTLFALQRIDLPPLPTTVTNIRGVWRAFPLSLRWLLASDVFIRTCEAMVDIFLVIYATSIVGITVPEFGVLIAIQTLTSIAVYIPAAKIADAFGRKPFVVATFVAFSLFPLAVVFAKSFAALAAAFVVAGLREIGEPSRKALIVDLADPSMRGRTVGLYYLMRSLAIAPAAIVGGLLWEQSPSLPMLVATTIGLAGTVVFIFTVDET